MTKKKCYELEIPSQTVSNALAGGGIEPKYFTEQGLAGANGIVINAQSLPTPTSLEELQNNFVLFEDNDMDVYLK